MSLAAQEREEGNRFGYSPEERKAWNTSAPLAPVKPAASVALKPGEKADDGSIYLGFYEGKDWFVAATDVKDRTGIKNLTMTFNEAAHYAGHVNLHGHKDWQLPPLDILKEMYQHKQTGAFKGTFNEKATGSVGARWYWSCAERRVDPSRVHDVDFTDGGVGWARKDSLRFSSRVVRAVLRPSGR